MNSLSKSTLFLLFGLTILKSQSKSLNTLYEKPGNITIIGAFGGYDCHIQSLKSLEEMASAIWVVEALNKYEYFHELKIGLSIYDVCEKNSLENKELISKISRKYTLNATTFNAGILINSEDMRKLWTEFLGPIMQIRSIIDEFMLVDLLIQFLINLQKMVIDILFAESEDLINAFEQKATSEGIYTYNHFLINDSLLNLNLSDSDKPKIVVIMAQYRNIVTLLKDNTNFLRAFKFLNVILVPTDLIFQPFKDLPKQSVVFLPAIGNKDILKQFLEGNNEHKDFFNHKEPTKSPLFIRVASAILKLLLPLKVFQDKHCKVYNDSVYFPPCPKNYEFVNFQSSNPINSLPMVPVSDLNSSVGLLNVLDSLKLERNSSGEMFLFLAFLVSEDTIKLNDEVAIFQLFNLKTKIFRPVLLKIDPQLFDNFNEPTEEPEKILQVCSMTNFDEFHAEEDSRVLQLSVLHEFKNSLKKIKSFDDFTAGTDRNDSSSKFPRKITFNSAAGKNSSEMNLDAIWRTSTWVVVNTCLSFVGLLSILCVMIFIVCRIWAREAIEGSPIFIILFMFALTFLFTISFCFHFKALPNISPYLCACRSMLPSFVYSILFSQMLSRSIMLAFSNNQNGFISHINGYLQSILFISFMGIQMSLMIQAWLYEGIPKHDQSCMEVHRQSRIIFSFFYNYVLLALLLFTGPFIIQFQRNYKEGPLLALSGFLVAATWSAWTACYYLLPSEYHDAAIALGLNSTSLILFTFAILPRVYLMTDCMTRYRKASFLPRKARHSLPELSNINNKSNDLPLNNDFCETFNIGVLNPNFV